jgi:thioredoxin 1
MSKAVKIAIVLALVVVVVAVIVMKKGGHPAPQPTTQSVAGIPRLLDLGSVSCIPCKMMAPILEDLKKEFAGRLQVEFVDVVNVNPAAGKHFGIKLIPTQVFFDASGKEFFRHEGFISKGDILAKFKEKGIDLAKAEAPAFERLEPAAPDTRPSDKVCHMCDGDINPKTLVVVKTDKGDVRLCSPHCYFIMYSCLTEDKTGFEKKVSVTDYATGARVAASEAVYLCGVEEKSGRPWVKAFAGRDDAGKEMRTAGGSIVAWAALQESELSHRCGFCDRACYPSDASRVLVDGIQTWGCCSHCALGVAARTGKDIEVHERDRLTGEAVVVKTLGGSVALLEPPTAVAWLGLKKKPDGTFASAGCFHQGFFVNAENLRKWAEQNPTETGRLIPISQALADKMKLTPQQIQKACKIGECAPK